MCSIRLLRTQHDAATLFHSCRFAKSILYSDLMRLTEIDGGSVSGASRAVQVTHRCRAEWHAQLGRLVATPDNPPPPTPLCKVIKRSQSQSLRRQSVFIDWAYSKRAGPNQLKCPGAIPPRVHACLQSNLLTGPSVGPHLMSPSPDRRPRSD